MRRILINASVASMIYKFNMTNIEILQSMGFHVDVACNFGDENPISSAEISDFRRILKEKQIHVYETVCPRKVTAIGRMIKCYCQLKRIIGENKYDLIHTQSPIGGVLCRIAAVNARKLGTKVIYTAHGFHFYKGAPRINWILFYPIEKLCSRFTDVLVTINKEDYKLAKEKFYAKKVHYIPGVGIDSFKFRNCRAERLKVRESLNIPKDAFVLISAGELADRKNQKVVIDAIGEIYKGKFNCARPIYYLIAGEGKLKEFYSMLARQYKISKQVILLGQRTDLERLYKAADVFIHPSTREGLGIAPLEAMAAGLPLISSYINGIKDYTKDNVTGCCVKDPTDVVEVKKAILKMVNNSDFCKQCGENNIKVAAKFDVSLSKAAYEKIYGDKELWRR